MALTPEDKKEIADTMSRAIADGLKLFRSEAEEEAAKNPPKEEPEKTVAPKKVDLVGFFLGAK